MRLIVQNQIYGPLTRHFLTGAGVTAGMKVLDLGSGAGDVARLLADLVGPQGRVVGVDTNAAILETARGRVQAAGWTTVVFRHGVERLDLGEEFDAVVGRWVLMYLPNPADLLRKTLPCLRPGGIVAFQESDLGNPRNRASVNRVHAAALAAGAERSFIRLGCGLSTTPPTTRSSCATSTATTSKQ